MPLRTRPRTFETISSMLIDTFSKFKVLDLTSTKLINYLVRLFKKTRSGRERRSPDIILRRDRDMVPAKKNLQTLAPITSGPSVGWHAGRNPGAGGAQRGDFFNQARNSPPRGIEPRTWRCYSEALTITLEALSHVRLFRSSDSL
jgi:hypothetical protein